LPILQRILTMNMSSSSPTDTFAAARQEMVELQIHRRGIRDLRVLDAMARVPRHEFVPGAFRQQAYEDHPIPIDEGQSISQPYIVAVTVEALSLEPSHLVLEIGTGSGYQTALLAELCRYVYSVERHAKLATQAQATLRRLGYSNVLVLVGDGSKGLADFAPFDGIAVSAAAPRMPEALFQQLREGGRMAVPVGPADVQELQLVQKRNGLPEVAILEGCRFVPLIGDQGYSNSFPTN